MDGKMAWIESVKVDFDKGDKYFKIELRVS